jgi:hypothetical protein
VLITASAAVGDHVHQERDQQLRRERSAACETLSAELEVACDGALDLQRYRFESGTKFSPARFGPSEIPLAGEKKHVAANRIRCDVRILADPRARFTTGAASLMALGIPGEPEPVG